MSAGCGSAASQIRPLLVPNTTMQRTASGWNLADVLLTHSYHLPYDAKQLRKMQPYTPIGTLYAATTLRDHGVSVAVFDTMLQAPGDKFRAMLEEHRPRVVAVYEDDFNFLSKMCLTRMREVAGEIVEAARKVGAVTVIHGSDATDNPDLFLAAGFDYILCGEAEAILLKLCSAILADLEVPEMEGLVRRGASGRIIGDARRLAKNSAWSELALPARDLIDLAPYRAAWTQAHGYFSTNMVASRGCPFHCNWCAKPISGNRFHLRAASAVAHEMSLLKSAGVEHIWFGDDVFALNQHWTRELADEVVAREAAVPFKIQSRADLMRDDTVLHLKAAGCVEVWMGVESGSQAILDAMEKGVKLETIVVARRRLRAAGVRACFFLQLGYPGETWTELQSTIEFVRKLRPDDIGVSLSYPLPGTAFYERVQAQLGEKRNWKDSDDLCVMFQAAYTTEFYRAVREALHAEVDSWKQAESEGALDASIEARWSAVHAMEPHHRVANAFEFAQPVARISAAALVTIEPVEARNL